MGSEKLITVGPWGGPDGNNHWSHRVVDGGIKQIAIGHGLVIDSIRFRSHDGHTMSAGGDGGRTDSFDIDWPGEYLTNISGTYGIVPATNSQQVLVTSLRFHTNRTIHGPYGVESGTHFEIPIKGAAIVGFYGRAGGYLNAIGVNVLDRESVK